MTSPLPASALDDVRVLDLTGEMGVYCTRLLADLGADVLRVEPPAGDPIRRKEPFLADRPGPERSLLHQYFNASKRGLTLDITSDVGRDLFRKLVSTADIVVETFAPGYLAGLGLGYDDLVRIKPDIILTSMTGFGQDGPHAAWLSSDLVGVAMSGIMTLAGFPDLPPYRPYPSQGYYCASVDGAVGTLVALTSRDLTGEGQWVEVSMQEALSIAQETAMQTWDMTKTNRKRMGAGFRIGLTGLYECRDGYVYGMIGIGSAGASSAAFVSWMDEEGMAGDLIETGVLAKLEEAGGFMRGSADAIQRMMELAPTMEKVRGYAAEFMKSHTMHELYEVGQAHGFLLGPANSPKDLVESPQLEARNYFANVEHPELGVTLKMPGVPYRLAESPASIRRRAPLLGEHNDEVYGYEIGLSRDEFDGLKKAGVI